MPTTAITEQAKTDFFNGGMCLQTTQTGVSCAGTSGAFALTGLASTAGLSVGMAASGTNVAAGAVIASVDSASQVTLSKAHAGTVSAATFTGDLFKILLINPSATGTYDQTLLNVGTPGTGSPSPTNVGTDEVSASGTGYTSGGELLANVSAVLSGSTAVGSFSVNPSWTSATFSTICGVIYNSSARIGAAAAPLNNHTVGVFDFGGTQTVSAGTLTLIIPTANSSTGLLRIS